MPHPLLRFVVLGSFEQLAQLRQAAPSFAWEVRERDPLSQEMSSESISNKRSGGCSSRRYHKTMFTLRSSPWRRMRLSRSPFARTRCGSASRRRWKRSPSGTRRSGIPPPARSSASGAQGRARSRATRPTAAAPLVLRPPTPQGARSSPHRAASRRLGATRCGCLSQVRRRASMEPIICGCAASVLRGSLRLTPLHLRSTPRRGHPHEPEGAWSPHKPRLHQCLPGRVAPLVLPCCTQRVVVSAPPLLQVIRLILRKCGILNPEVVDNGEKAALAACQLPFDLILMARDTAALRWRLVPPRVLAAPATCD